MKKNILLLLVAISFLLLAAANLAAQTIPGRKTSFNSGWKFLLGDDAAASSLSFNDVAWRSLDLPHDWSIELPFDKESPTGTGGGALRGGTGWYRKTFMLPASLKGKNIFIDFDGVYMNSEVWINGHSLGVRPNGYISFRYDLTPYVEFGGEKNVIAVKVDNSKQPNSRWYSGSGIYRNVWLVSTGDLFVDHWGTYITTPQVNDQSATVDIKIHIHNTNAADKNVVVKTTVYDAANKKIATLTSALNAKSIDITETSQQIKIISPHLWSINSPYLYKAKTEVIRSGKTIDEYTTSFGIRYFNFDIDKGFSLNGKPVKIIGVCDHHDLGCLGTAINTRALERQLEMLKSMGINGIRTSHNPPAPELLDLADKMGFIVMDEAFDMWKKEKNPYDYHLYWDEWHKKDLQDQVLRDRNHPSVFIWSIGNEIPEQWGGNNDEDTSGRSIARELAAIIHSLDTTRPITSALNNPWPGNEIYKSGALDLIGFNYNQNEYKNFPKTFPGKKFIATETISSLNTRGHYDMPSDSIRRWPARWDKPIENANADLTCSAYDNCSAPWGSTHEETLKELLKYDFASGMFLWTGFDYIGEPTPYPWPARSSYFGIIDLAGFPKDVYYLYQSLFTNKPVLHIFPHWSWEKGQTIDVWAYYNNADEVELFLNGKSLGIKKKTGDAMHVMWRVVYEPGILKAVSRKNGKIVLSKEIHTAGTPAKIIVSADRNTIHADGKDLSFVTARIVDKDGNLVPDADNLITFTKTGEGKIAATDNGSETDLESFKVPQHKAFNGLCLAVIQSTKKTGTIQLTVKGKGLSPATIFIQTK
ncbi:MAG: beta-galactosidase GalB [Chitinophagales bacterium]